MMSSPPREAVTCRGSAESARTIAGLIDGIEHELRRRNRGIDPELARLRVLFRRCEERGSQFLATEIDVQRRPLQASGVQNQRKRSDSSHHDGCELLSIPQVGAMIGRHANTVRNRIADGSIETVLEGRAQRIRRSEAQRYLDSLPKGRT
jgi:hypothetical protein